MSARRCSLRPVIAGLIAVAFIFLAPIAGASVAHSKRTPAVGLIPFPGDVYTLNYQGALIPVDPSSTLSSAPLYNLAGNTLNETWGQFSSATATSLAKTITKHRTEYSDIKISLSGLIPNGVYSLFYRTFGPDSNNPVCTSGIEPLIALPALRPERQKPDQDSFVADRKGRANFHARASGNLLAAQQFQIVVIYHFDGNVYGPVANAAEADNCRGSSYGIDAIRQLLIIQM